MQLDVLLVHGFLGAPADFRDLAERLAETDGVETITALRLPLHGEVAPPPFQTETFIGCVSEAIGRAACRKRGLVILGHSTGGNLVLSALKNVSIMLRLLILAAVPRRIDLSYLGRWHQLTSQRSAIPLSSVAAMVTLINGTSAAAMRRCLFVLAIHGACDGLVPVSDLQRWQAERDSIPLRTVAIPEAGHALFAGPGSDLAIDAVCRAISDASRWAGETQKSLKALTAIEPEMGEFLAASPFSAAHLLQSPSGRQCLCQSPPMTPAAAGEPVFANIEITTRCNLQCRYCARSFRPVRLQEMSLATFERILDLLPHAYRITLVGLGEPLLPPQVADFVVAARRRHRWVGLVTNAMNLSPAISAGLMDAGLNSIAFSLDTVAADVVEKVRSGSDLNRILENIRGFMSLAGGAHRVSAAVFSAVSIDTVYHLTPLVELVAGLGVHVLMLSDLNFHSNQAYSLWRCSGEELEIRIRQSLKAAFALNLPVLSIDGLEAFGLAARYRDFLLLSSGRLIHRRQAQPECFSPWQTLPIDVEGNAYLCDCQPEQKLGHVLTQPLYRFWNGGQMIEHRSRMLGPDPPPACKGCPRF